MTCSVLYAMDFPVLWVKVDKEKITEPVMLSSGSTLIIKDSRFSLRQDIDSTSYTLQVFKHWFKYIFTINVMYYTCVIFVC